MPVFTKRSTQPTSADEHATENNITRTSSDGSLRVLFVVDSFLPGAGGAEIQALNLGKALSDKGLDIEFVAPRLHKRWPKIHTLSGMKVTKIDYPRIKLLGSAILILKFAVFLLRNRNSFDAIHIHITGKLASMAGILRPFVNATMVAKISGYYEFEEGVLREQQGMNLISAFNRAGLHKIDYFQTISLQTREKLLSAGFKERQIKHIPNGIELSNESRMKPAGSNEVFTIGFCGRLRDIKGVDVLINALAILVNEKNQKNVKLTIAGEGRTQPKLEKLIATHKLEAHVEFLGIILETDIFMSGLDLYVQPSYAEGLPNSVIEAMNAGCPIVATDIGGNNDLVEDGANGFLVPAGDHALMADRIESCLELGGRLVDFSERSVAIIQAKYGFDSVTEDLILLYQGGATAHAIPST